jgi:hypothetical protein
MENRKEIIRKYLKLKYGNTSNSQVIFWLGSKYSDEYFIDKIEQIQKLKQQQKQQINLF